MKTLTTLDQTIGENVQDLRDRYDKSQARLAEYLTKLTGDHWDQQTVSRSERGDRPWRIADLFAIAAIFDVSIAALIDPKPDVEYVVVGVTPYASTAIVGEWLMYSRRRGHIIEEGRVVRLAEAEDPLESFTRHIQGVIDAHTGEVTLHFEDGTDLTVNKEPEEKRRER